MFNLHSVLLIAHVFVSAAIIVLVLLQRGKGADAGAAFGSGASGTVFGAKGSANFLSRTTAVLAAMFFISSLSLAYLGSRSQEAQRSLMDEIVTPAEDISSAIPVTEGDLGATGVLPDLPATEAPATREMPTAEVETEVEQSP